MLTNSIKLNNDKQSLLPLDRISLIGDAEWWKGIELLTKKENKKKMGDLNKNDGGVETAAMQGSTTVTPAPSDVNSMQSPMTPQQIPAQVNSLIWSDNCDIETRLRPDKR